MKRKTLEHPPAPADLSATELRDLAAPPALPALINVRAAKDQLSSLLDQAAAGNEIVITSDGVPKARLVPYVAPRKPFRVDWALLRSVSVKPGGKSAETLVREDRDGRP